MVTPSACVGCGITSSTLVLWVQTYQQNVSSTMYVCQVYRTASIHWCGSFMHWMVTYLANEAHFWVCSGLHCWSI